MSGISVKMDLIKLDLVVKDIHHIWQEVPSQYIAPKSILAESRATLRSNVKKSLSLAEKARKVFQKESILATEYNLIVDRIPMSGESARHKNALYLESISKGDYETAENYLEELVAIAGSSDGKDPHLDVTLISDSTDGCTISFCNDGDNAIMIMSLQVTKGSETVTTDPKNTFSVQAKSTRKVIVGATLPIHVSAHYMEKGEKKCLDKELTE